MEIEKTKPQIGLSFTTINIMRGCMPKKANCDNPVINVILAFDNAPQLDDIVSDVRTLFQYHRLSTVPKGTYGSNNWRFESVGDIDPKRMVRLVNISCDTKEECADIIRQQPDESLRREDLPWWEFVYMVNKGKGEHFLLFRIHHAIADGLSLAKIFPSIIKRTDGSKVTSLIPQSMISNKAKVERNILQMILKLPKAILEISFSPFGKYDDPTYFSKNIGGNNTMDSGDQKLIVFDHIPIDFIKKIKDKAAVGLNDVLLAAWSHAVSEYCLLQECPVLKAKKQNLLFRVFLTYGFPHKMSPDHVEPIENAWAPLPLKLPVGLESISQKLYKIFHETIYLKSSPLALVQLILQEKILKILPLSLCRETLYRVYSRRSMTVTSVPGPQEKVMIAGEVVKSCYFSVNSVHPVLSILSYNEKFNITLTVDDTAISDAHLLPIYFMRALVLLGNNFKIDVPKSVLQASQ